MKKIVLLLKYHIIIFVSFFTCKLEAIEPWTAMYSSVINQLPEQGKKENKSVLIFAKHDILPFSQLIFSWNIEYLNSGFFSFFVMARDSKTKEWYPWHKMADWSNNYQHSYKSEFSGSTGYHHVRLEMPFNKKADAFRIKIIANNGA